MKDLYTFDKSKELALETYHSVRAAYAAFFDEFKVPYVEAEADSGSIGGDLSHEYHIAASNGEDDVLVCQCCNYAVNEELFKSKDDHPKEPALHPVECPDCEGILQSHKAIELGHTFYLGTKYSQPLAARVATDPESAGPNARQNSLAGSDEEGSSRSTPMEMGCYGIGVSRIIAGMAHALSDEKGLNWPRVMAPFEAVVIPVKDTLEDATEVLDSLGGSFNPRSAIAGVDAVLDDRSKDMAWKLHDADLIGYPVVIVLGRSWRRNRMCEVQCRRLGYKQDVKLEELPNVMGDLLERL